MQLRYKSGSEAVTGFGIVFGDYFMKDNKIRIFVTASGIVMSLIFILNLFLSREYNVLWIALSGGGTLIDYLGASFSSAIQGLQLYRLITYGYTQAAIWHLIANVLALVLVSEYFQKHSTFLKFILVYHVGMIVAGAAFVLLFKNGIMYGASPAIFACLGLMVNRLVQKKESLANYKSLKGFWYLLGYLILSNFLGFDTFAIHLMGFAAGFLMGFLIP